MTTYNEYYKKEDYFGEPYPELMNYFMRFDKKNKILDLGCGQGRDSLELGRMGFNVTGLDISKVGIDQLNKVAKEEGLNVIGKVIDYNVFQDINEYDFILMNSMFHFYKNDIDTETKALNRILDMMKDNARLVIVIQENNFRVAYIKEVLNQSDFDFIVDFEKSILYKEFNSKFYIISIQKNTNEKS